MPDPIDLFQQGKLQEAVTAAADAVKSKPSDVAARSLFCEFLCYTRDWERADKQLDAIIKIDRDSMIGASMFRHLIRCEVARDEVFNQGRVPQFVDQPSEVIQKRLEALTALRAGDAATTARLATEAAGLEPELTGKYNGQEFSGIRDLDDLLGTVLEVFTATGEYYWVSLAQVESLEFEKPTSLVDQLWRRARIDTVGELSGHIHIPVIYFGSSVNEDGRVQIGRATDWIEAAPGLIRGHGQREFLIGEDAVTILEFKNLELNP